MRSATIATNLPQKDTDISTFLSFWQNSLAEQQDVEKGNEKAIEAFTRHGYIILVNDQQVADIDAAIELRAGTEVTFFKLVPLVGG
jgi:hypothetical protein